MSWVIDASSVVDLLSSGPRSVRTWAIVGDDVLHAPDLVVGEVMSALARSARAGHPGAGAAAQDFATMPLTTHPTMPLATSAWTRRESLRIADAFYVELARTLALPLVTSDVRLGRTIQQQSLCDVRVVDVAGPRHQE